MTEERKICPGCGHPIWDDATAAERASEPPRICSPLRCDQWVVVGRATAPHPITGGQTMLRVVPDEKGGK